MNFESTLFRPNHDEPANGLQSETAGIVDFPLGEGFSLPALLETVARYYLERAIEQANGKKTAAAKLVGLPSYQTFANWVARYKAQPGTSRTASMSSRHEEGRLGELASAWRASISSTEGHGPESSRVPKAAI
jgi:hypothetical protein